jgi:Zn-finger nucleic acid-binding protein
MSDNNVRLGDKLHQHKSAREDQWAHQRDEKILEKLRHKLVKVLACPQCGKNLTARVAIGVGGVACPDLHGAWGDRKSLEQLRASLEIAAAFHHESLGERVFEIVEELRHKHPTEIGCPVCAALLAAHAPIAPDSVGFAAMACPNGHGAWIDQRMLAEIRKRLDFARRAASSRSN